MPSSNPNKAPSKTPTTTIKIAAKEASKRTSAGADPGPGDVSAAPSEAPQLIDLPDPPTPSELVVKSTNSKRSAGSPATGTGAGGTLSEEQKPSQGYKSALGASKSKSKPEGSVAGPAADHPSVGASATAHEATSSKPLTGPTEGAASGVSGHHSASGSHHSAAGSHHSAAGSHHSAGGSHHSAGGTHHSMSHKSGTGSQATGAASGAGEGASSPGQQGSGAPNTASAAMQADSGAVHDEDEEGEGEVEQPETPGPASPGDASAASGASSSTPTGGLRGTSQPDSPSMGAAASSPQGSASVKSTSSPASSPASAMVSRSSRKSSSKKSRSPSSSSLIPSGMESSKGGASSSALGKKNGKKVTKFRYHKRITVRTSGKTSPTAIMDKVNKKDHNAGITPSTIEDMDPQELMRRAGIKGTNKTHWRVRLRQTKRLTKNGKTVSQTKVAYRDSEGNKRIKTSSSPFCKNCGKKLEECKCETSSQNSNNQ